MLTLERKEGESIIIQPSPDLDPSLTVTELFANGLIEITIKDIKPGKAKILIDAPQELSIAREEILD